MFDIMWGFTREAVETDVNAFELAPFVLATDMCVIEIGPKGDLFQWEPLYERQG